MKPDSSLPVKRLHCRRRRYATLSLLELFSLLAADAVAEAVRELFEERLFPFKGRLLRVTDVIKELSNSRLARVLSGKNQVVVDCGMDLTGDKLFAHPNARRVGDPTRSGLPAPGRRVGVDCRYYYRALMRYLEQTLEGKPHLREMDREQLIENAFLKFVTRHFFFSVRSCWRQLNGLVSRYTWHTPTGPMTLWLPVDIAGPDRRKWLEDHVGAVDLSRPGERERVQELIDQLTVKRRMLSLSVLGKHLPDARAVNQGLPWSIEYGISVAGFAQTVALEKKANIHQQRRCIRLLGAEVLEELILRIFTDLEQFTFFRSGFRYE